MNKILYHTEDKPSTWLLIVSIWHEAHNTLLLFCKVAESKKKKKILRKSNANTQHFRCLQITMHNQSSRGDNIGQEKSEMAPFQKCMHQEDSVVVIFLKHDLTWCFTDCWNWTHVYISKTFHLSTLTPAYFGSLQAVLGWPMARAQNRVLKKKKRTMFP